MGMFRWDNFDINSFISISVCILYFNISVNRNEGSNKTNNYDKENNNKKE